MLKQSYRCRRLKINLQSENIGKIDEANKTENLLLEFCKLHNFLITIYFCRGLVGPQPQTF